MIKKLPEKAVIRIVTPGTTLDAQALDETKNNYWFLMYLSGKYGFCSGAYPY